MPTSALARPPEDRLLLCCARTSRSPEVAEQIETLLQEDMDWEYLIRTARRHGITPLVYWHLSAISPKTVPESAFQELRGYFHANNLYNLLLTGELLKILSLFKAHGILAVPYKGPALAASVYGNLALREFSDLDILLRRRDVLKAKELLASLRYIPRYQLNRAQETALLNDQHQYIFMRDDEKCAVELHWEITEHFSFSLDPERMWRRLEQMTLAGDTVPTLSPEDTLLILCAHGAKHLWEQLEWICDVAELIKAYRDIRWERVIVQASELGGERMLLLGLFLAHELLEAPLPEKISQRINADPTVKALGRQIGAQLFREASTLGGVFKEAYFHPLHLKMKESLADKIRYCVRAATTQTVDDWELVSLPNFLLPLYYVLRPIRLAAKYVTRLLRRPS